MSADLAKVAGDFGRRGRRGQAHPTRARDDGDNPPLTAAPAGCHLAKKVGNVMRLLAIEQKDGTYLVRPFGGSPFVYHADELVTGQLIKFYRKYNSWAFWGALLSGALGLPVLLNFWSDDLLIASVIFAIATFALAALGAVTGVLFILRHASRVPPATFPTPKPKAEQVRWRLLRATAAIAAWLSLVALFVAPDYLPWWRSRWSLSSPTICDVNAHNPASRRRPKSTFASCNGEGFFGARSSARWRIRWRSGLPPVCFSAMSSR